VKKLLSMILVVSMLAICASCGTNKSSEKPETVQTEEKGEKEESAEQTKEAVGVSLEGKRVMLALNALGDLSFNDLLYKGLLAIQDTYGLEVEYAEVGTDISTYEGYFFDFVDAGYDYVFLRSGFMELCETYAADYPDMRFIVYDTTPLDTCSADNVYLYSIATYQAAFLVGMAAAGTSETGVIGFVGGQENPLINDFLCGYIQGALYADENIKVCSAFMGDYNDAGKAMELATAQIDQGADIIMNVANITGIGAMEAAAEQGAYAIGVDTNQDSLYPGHILTSMQKNVDNCTFQIIESAVNDEFEGGTAIYMDLAHDGVGLSDFSVMKEALGDKFPQDIVDKVEELKEKIVSGEIVVDSYEGYGKPEN